MVTVGAGLSLRAEPREAAIEAAMAAREPADGAPPSLGVLFASPHHTEGAETLLDAVHEAAAPEALIGCVGESVIGGDREVEGEPAVAVWLAWFPGPVRPYHVRFTSAGAFEGFPHDEAGGTHLMVADPFSFPPEPLLRGLEERGPGTVVVGGMASGGIRPGTTRLFLDREVVQDGAIGVRLPETVRVRTLVSQGCRPIGPAFTITKGEGNVIEELAGGTPMERIREVHAAADERTRALMAQGLQVGRVIDEHKDEFERGDFLVRGVIGADRDTGAIAVGDQVAVGETVRFHVRDAGSADEEAAGEYADQEVIARIREEGLTRSQVMDHVSWLADVHGPRLTGSPAARAAGEWARGRLAGWGLANVREQPFAFGTGWSLVRFSAHMVAPQPQPLIGYPRAWTPGTGGPIRAEVVRVRIRGEADFARYRGRLRGRIVLLQPERRVPLLEGPVVLRMSEADLREAEAPLPAPADVDERPPDPAPRLRARIARFLHAEGVAAVFDRGPDEVLVSGGSDLSWRTQRTDGGTVFVEAGGTPRDAPGVRVPAVTLAVEHYNRMVRVLDRGVPVEVELHIDARFHPEGRGAPNGFNILAELPGTDLAHEVVMIGAHLDSMHAGTGATDNAAGVAAVMEAARVLLAAGARPRRTIRLGLWGGEEQGLLGSRAYVRETFGDPASRRFTPEHARLSAYFNVDNGTGRIRGVWLQDNETVRPVFERWIAPLADLGVTTLGPRAVGSTDHLSFDAAGLPAFQFMQDRLEYRSRTHHSTMDVVDRVQEEDLRQVATVTAIFAYRAAMRDEQLPRKPAAGR